MTDFKTRETTVADVVAVAKCQLLEQGGVDNWEWYSDSLEDNNYITSEDKYEDAKNFLQALEKGGVDNWEWHDESLRDLAGYEEYVESLSKPSSAVSYYQWEQEGIEAQRKADEATENTPESTEDNTEPEETKYTVEDASDKVLYDFIVNTYGEGNVEDIYSAVKEDGTVYKFNTFPKEYKKALQVIQMGVQNPLEKARVELLELTKKNGKLKSFVDTLLENNRLRTTQEIMLPTSD